MEKKLNSFVVAVFTIFLLFFCLLPLFFALGSIMNKNETITQIAETDLPSNDVEVDAIRDTCLLTEGEDLGMQYVDRFVFLGESTTYGLWRYGILSQGTKTEQVWTGANALNGKIQCAGTLSLSPTIAQTPIYYPNNKTACTIAEAARQSKPEYLVVTMGLNNGASYYTEDQFKQCYRILLNSVIEASEDTKIILQSIFPVAETCKVAAYTPERIRLCNTWIFDLAAEYNIKYLDTFSALANENGFLKPQYENGGDGIHLNEEGLSAVIHYIRTHGHPEEYTA